MEFCEKCGALTIVKEGKPMCPSCGHKLKRRPSIKSSQKVEKKEDIVVVKKEENPNPIVDMKCQKCKNKKCYFWSLQTRAADESETKFYKCTKCGHTWRDYR